MYRTQRLSSVLTSVERGALEQLARVEGGLAQSGLLHRLTHEAARERRIWPPDRQRRIGQQTQGV
jgi:hypothetical protein